MTARLSRESVVVVAKDQVSSDVGDESVILNMKSGSYYGLDPVGRRVWSMMQTSQPIAKLHEAMIEEFDVDPARCEQDLMELLEQLLKEGLIELKSDPQT
jgi:Coenzyme PQQ synthesis protein D (PqqD)